MNVDQEQFFMANIGEIDTPVGKLRGIFTGKCKFDDHYDAQVEDLEQYLSVLAVLEKSGVEVLYFMILINPWCILLYVVYKSIDTQGAKVRCLAASWARYDYKLAEILLTCKDKFSLREVLKALALLDSAREERALEKRLKRLDIQKHDPLRRERLKTIWIILGRKYLR